MGTNIVDKIINDINVSSSQLLSIFNKNKSKSLDTELSQIEMNGSEMKNDDVVMKEKSNESSINFFDFAKQSVSKNELFLDKFAWWKEARAKNKSHAIDAEDAHDAITDYQDHNLRKTQSCSNIKRNEKRRASIQ